MIDWLSFGLGAVVLWCMQGVYRIGREHGAISERTDEKNKEYLVGIIRQAPSERLDISRAERRDWWN